MYTRLTTEKPEGPTGRDGMIDTLIAVAFMWPCTTTETLQTVDWKGWVLLHKIIFLKSQSTVRNNTGDHFVYCHYSQFFTTTEGLSEGALISALFWAFSSVIDIYTLISFDYARR
jgi:hypothetical protein